MDSEDGEEAEADKGKDRHDGTESLQEEQIETCVNTSIIVRTSSPFSLCTCVIFCVPGARPRKWDKEQGPEGQGKQAHGTEGRESPTLSRANEGTQTNLSV